MNGDGWRKRPRLAVLLTLIVALGAIVGWSVASAATETAKPYDASISPTGVAAGTPFQWFTYRITNKSNQGLGSANISIPDGWTVLQVTTPATVSNPTKIWSAKLGTGVIELRASGTSTSQRLAQDEYVEAVFQVAQVPCNAVPNPAPWSSTAKQSNKYLGGGNDFFPTSTPTVLVTGGCATKLVVDSVVGVPGPEVVKAPATFNVTVHTEDDFGNVAAVGADTTLSLTKKTGFGTLGGNTSGTIGSDTSQTTITGVTYSQADSPVVLTASSPPLTGDSAPFQVFDAIKKTTTSANTDTTISSESATAPCTDTTPEVNTCITAFLHNGAVGGVTVFTGYCQALLSNCDGSLTGVFANLGDLYTRFDLALIRVELDKTISGGGGPPHIDVYARFDNDFIKPFTSGEKLDNCKKPGVVNVGQYACVNKEYRDGTGDAVIEILKYKDFIAGHR